MKLIVVGTGFVGLPHAAIMAEAGHEAYAYDIDEKRITAYKSNDRAQIEHYVNEPGLANAISNTIDKHLHFTTDLASVIEGVDVVFMCLNTPPNRDGSTDLTYYLAAANTLGDALASRKEQKRVVIVNKSTVPIGTARLLEGVLTERGAKNFGVASNPEFLAQGSAIEGSRRPDRVVVGTDTDEDRDIMRRVYSQFFNHVRIAFVETTPETAESIKYVANTLLLTYISFWNGVSARLGESIANINMDDLKRGVTADSRISTWGSYVSNGAGGSCFGKDIQSLMYQLRREGKSDALLQSVYSINEHQKTYLFDRAEYEGGFNFNNKTVAILGLAFKKRTNDMRDSAALNGVETLLARGTQSIRAYDPLSMGMAQEYWFNPERNQLFDRISYHENAADAMQGADAIYISTDWEEFRGLTKLIKEIATAPCLIIDGRRMIADPKELTDAGFQYMSVGGTLIKQEETSEQPA